MRVAGQLTAAVLEAVSPMVQPGITTIELDEFCRRFIIEELKAIPGSLGQYDYPYSINTSVNHVVCHGMPNHKRLKVGDIVNIDVTVKKDGYYGDSSKMFLVGTVSYETKQLVETTQECLYLAIECVKPGATLGDIGFKIQQHAEKKGYSVVKEYCGHGIGKKMHEEPNVLHYGSPGKGVVLKAGMCFTIEPMINEGCRFTRLLKDGWTVITKDKKLSAQWEHTVLVTDQGRDVLTKRKGENIG